VSDGRGPFLGGSARVVPAARLRGALRLPGDKSIGHRALLFAAMGQGAATIDIDRPGADVQSTASALAALGALIGDEAGPDETRRYTIGGGGTAGAARLPGEGGESLDCGNAGTGMRLLAGALAGRPAAATLQGDASLSSRPMERVAAPLRAMGATVETTDGHAPVRVTGTRPLRALRHELPVASAQVLGAVTLAALAADGRTSVDVPGPTRDHTERMLAWLGAPVRRQGLRTLVDGPAGFRARSMAVPGDPSSAAFWLAAAAIHPDAQLVLRGVALNPSRLAVVAALHEMGADIEVNPDAAPGADGGHAPATGPEPVGDLVVRGGRPLRAIELVGDRVADLIDELPLLAVVMAAADGTSEVRDARELRVKESDRIALVVAGLRAVGADAEELPDGWRVRRGQPREAAIETRGDHRIAMAFAIGALAGVASSVVIDHAECTGVSYPGFWDDLARVSDAPALATAAI
jgi:3-phosphoshikimate 1-carboxyvinyltransferase